MLTCCVQLDKLPNPPYDLVFSFGKWEKWVTPVSMTIVRLKWDNTEVLHHGQHSGNVGRYSSGVVLVDCVGLREHALLFSAWDGFLLCLFPLITPIPPTRSSQCHLLQEVFLTPLGLSWWPLLCSHGTLFVLIIAIGTLLSRPEKLLDWKWVFSFYSCP